MKNASIKLVLTVLTCIVLCTVTLADDRPNIIFIMADDMGKEWAGCYGGEGNHTPNIDQLAATGMTFDNAYSMPKCVASRMTLMTGQYPCRNGYVDHWEIQRGSAFLDPQKNPSWPLVMRQAGYKTCAVGKWQLTIPGRDIGSINQLGFDEHFLWVRSDLVKQQPRYWTSFYSFGDSTKPLKGKQFDDGFGPDHTFNYAKDFIARNKKSPFFLYYAFHLPHVPFVHTPGSPNTGDKPFSRCTCEPCQKLRAAGVKDINGVEGYPGMVRYLDYLTGQLVSFLEEEGLRKNTIIIFTTDNGSSGMLSNMRNGRLMKGAKGSITEQGIDAPFIVNYPGVVPHKRTKALLDFTDLLPTCAEIAGVPMPTGYKFDGTSQWPIWNGTTDVSQRPWMAAMGGKGSPGFVNEAGHVVNTYYYDNRVIKDGKFKLYIGHMRQPEALYDLENDPLEQSDLLANPEYKAVVAKLHGYAEKHFEKVDADPRYSPKPLCLWDKIGLCLPNCKKPPLADPDDPDRPIRVEYDKKRFQENAIKGKELLKTLRSRQSAK